MSTLKFGCESRGNVPEKLLAIQFYSKNGIFSRYNRTKGDEMSKRTKPIYATSHDICQGMAELNWFQKQWIDGTVAFVFSQTKTVYYETLGDNAVTPMSSSWDFQVDGECTATLEIAEERSFWRITNLLKTSSGRFEHFTDVPTNLQYEK